MRRAAPMFKTMSPASIAPIVDDPEICAVARDEQLKLVWCNHAYATNMGSTPERLIGTTLHDTMTPEQAKERQDMMRPVLYEGHMHAHQQVWVGKRWLTRVWPLDPDYFGHPGYFVLITRISDASIDERQIEFTRHSDLGPLGVLSKRELEVFYYLAIGMTAGDVARTLFRSEKTIGRHVENIHKKMGYTNRAQLVRDAVEAGLVTFSSEQWQEVINPDRPKD